MKKIKSLHKVLIVDDEEVICDTFSRLLIYAGYECQTAANGREALKLLEQQEFSLMLSDINMPVMSGIDLLRKTVEKYGDLAVLMISGVDDRDVAINCLEIGAYGYIIKPVQMNELVINVANALHRRDLEIVNKRYNQQLKELVAARTEELNLAREETIMTLGKAAEFRDNETAQHTIRMSHYCQLLARQSGLPENQCELIRLASPLHDIGKIGISDTILLKPGRLTPEEFVIIQQHSEIGYRILADSKSDSLRLGASIAYTHHEKFDGNGYPRRLKNSDIPIEGRIAAISDVFDALTTNRVYKSAIEVDKALAILKEGRGNHFDPDLLDIFFDNLDEVLRIKKECADPDK
ncbi:MAG: response regulator [Deltaproteobacteria bacterium]|nr:response regulator [Deltaproteobacteria bacterium]